MKKVYKRPELFYENFSLMEAIASCALTANQNDGASCTYFDEDGFGETLFLGANSDCAVPVEHYGVTFNNVFPS